MPSYRLMVKKHKSKAAVNWKTVHGACELSALRRDGIGLRKEWSMSLLLSRPSRGMSQTFEILWCQYEWDA